MDVKSKELFYCYSPNLQRFLIQDGFIYEKIGIHQKSNCIYMAFERSSKLDASIRKFKKQK